MKNVLIKNFSKNFTKKFLKKISQKNFFEKYFKNSKNFQKYKIYPSCVTIGEQKLLPLFT